MSSSDRARRDQGSAERSSLRRRGAAGAVSERGGGVKRMACRSTRITAAYRAIECLFYMPRRMEYLCALALVLSGVAVGCGGGKPAQMAAGRPDGGAAGAPGQDAPGSQPDDAAPPPADEGTTTMDGAAPPGAPGAPDDLRVGDRARPLNVEGTPLFGWLPHDPGGDQVQTAYQLQVRRESTAAMVWDS